MGHCNILELELIAVMPRKIWFRRNGLVHGGDFIHPQQVFRETSTSNDGFKRVVGIYMTVRSSTHIAPLVLWQPPPTWLYQVNWDAVVDKKHGELAMVLSLGTFQGFFWPHRDAVETCTKMGFHDIILEGKALQIVNAIKATWNKWSSFGHIVDGSKWS